MPADDDPGEAVRELERLAHRVAFFGSARVSRALGPVLAAAPALAACVHRIRADSTPCHRGRIDLRLAPAHQAAVAELDVAVRRFADAARTDLEIRGRFTRLQRRVVLLPQ